jgi:hypothetical protein
MDTFPDARSLCPPKGEDRSIHSLLPFKVALVLQLGIQEGFRVYRSMLGLPASFRIHPKRIESLRAFATSHSASFSEIFPSGEPFDLAPPKVIGPNDKRALTGTARSFFTTCLPDATIHGHSSLIHVNGTPLLDYEGNELLQFDDYLELDPCVFYARGDVAWVISNDGGDVPVNEEGAYVSVAGADTEYRSTAEYLFGEENFYSRPGVVEIDEAFGSLIGPHSPHFGHWLWEYLPKYLTAVLSGALPAVPVLINECMGPTTRDALHLLLPRGAKIIEVPFAPIRVKRLWWAPSLMYEPYFEKMNEKYTGPDHRCFPPARMLPALLEMGKRAEAVCLKDAGPERIFLARPDDLSRKLLNSAAIQALAKARGFLVVYPEELSFLEQVRLVRGARFVLGPEGSAHYLTFFSRPGTKQCILNHPFTLDVLNFTYLVEQIGVDVTLFTGPALKLNNEPGYPTYGFVHYADYEIDEEHFASFLEEWLDAGS